MLGQKLDAAFRSTCRTLFRQELGSLGEFRDYLASFSEPSTVRKSAVSGGEVHLSYNEYPKEGKFVSYNEVGRLPAPSLDIDDIKDIDSLIGAARENFCYCGDKNLGKTSEVEASDGCFDSSFVLESADVYKSRYIAYSAQLLDSGFMFGSTYAARTYSVISTFHSLASSRSFQSGYLGECSDTYLCWYLVGCQECILSFNQRGRKRLVGNVELSKEDYSALKEKLLGEMAEMLEKGKSFPSIFEIAGGVQA